MENIKKMKNSFWIDVLKSFIKFNRKNTLDEEIILKTPIFHNQCRIKIGGKVIFNNIWFKKGIRFINDLVKENGEFF